MMPADERVLEPGAEPPPSLGKSRGEDRFTVDFGTPMPQFDTAGAKAFLAYDPQEPGGRYFALIGHIDVPRRDAVLLKLLERPATRILSPLFDGLMELEDGVLRTVTILTAPGDRVLPAMAGPDDRVTEVTIRRIVVPQLAEALAELKFRGITHRNIRPETLFWRDDKRTQIVLGECFSAPPGVHQPAEAEILGRCMAARSGRGEGAPSSDLAAVGYLILALANGKPPQFQLEGLEQAMERAVRGSGAALTQGLNANQSVVNLIKGLLSDDAASQWGVEQIKQWTGGSEPTVRPASQLDQFLRPCKFNTITLGGRRALARAMAIRVKESAAFILTDAFANWTQNALSDNALVTRIKQILSSGAVREGSELLLVGRVRLIFDPSAALIIGPVEVAVDGIGPLLAAAMVAEDKETLAAIHRAFAMGLFQAALEFDHPTIADPRELKTQINAIAGYCKGERDQGGLERALYDLNPGLPCQSPHVRDYCARSIKDLLIALDRAAARNKITGRLIDRHVEGFIAARAEGRESRIDLVARAHGDPIDEIVATMKVLESLQASHYRGSLRNLTRWAAEALEGPCRNLRNKPRREASLMRLDALGASGSFVEFVRGLDFKALQERDQKEYRGAVSSWLNNEARAGLLLMRVVADDPNATTMGQRAAAVVAHCFLGISVVSTLLRFLF